MGVTGPTRSGGKGACGCARALSDIRQATRPHGGHALHGWRAGFIGGRGRYRLHNRGRDTVVP